MSYFDLKCARCLQEFWKHLPESSQYPPKYSVVKVSAKVFPLWDGSEIKLNFSEPEEVDCEEFRFDYQQPLFSI